MTVRLVVTIQTNPGQGHLQEAAFAALAETVRAEQGCLQYDLHRVQDEADSFVLIEHWESPEALQAHGASSHMAQAGKEGAAFRARPAQLVFLDGERVA